MPRKLTTEEFIKRAREVHGDKYSYDDVVYDGTCVKVTITCPIHGNFKQIPNSHLVGKGCSICGGTTKLKTDEFIEQSNAIHNNFYDYSRVIYKNNKTKVIIICPNHKDFEQMPTDHLWGYGCPKCGGSLKITTNEFIEQAQAIHNNFYNYDKVKYENITSKIIITCPIHGDFEQTPDGHLVGKGCFECGNIKKGKRRSDGYEPKRKRVINE